jgi:hypothetical protein
VGVKFAREYEMIITDLAQAIGDIEGCFELLEMDAAQWAQLDEADRVECLRTLADDIFYGLGSESKMSFGNDVIAHDNKKHLIQVTYGDQKIVRIIPLI